MSPQLYSSGPASDIGDVYVTTGGVMRRQLPQWPVIVVGALAIPGTSSAEPTRLWEAPFVRELAATASSPQWQTPAVAKTSTEDSAEVTRSAIAELRRISGLTWEQLGELFEVSRRSVHFWASGKALSAANEERLLRVLDVIREADRGDPKRTRAALFSPANGVVPFDLLIAQRFDEARALLGKGKGRRAVGTVALSPVAKSARRPLAPEELVDALHDQVHRDSRRGRAVRPTRIKRHERD